MSSGAALSETGVFSDREQKGIAAPTARDELIRCTDLLISTSGRIDPLWGDVNRHVRGDLNVPVAGGPDTLRAIYGMGMEKDGFSPTWPVMVFIIRFLGMLRAS